MPFIAPDIVTKVREMDLFVYLLNYEPQELVHLGGDSGAVVESTNFAHMGDTYGTVLSGKSIQRTEYWIKYLPITEICV